MRVDVLAVIENGREAIDEFLEAMSAAGADLIDVNGEPVLYRGYMTVQHSEIWEVDSHGKREYWIMSHCPFSTRYMWKRRFVVANRFRVVNGIAGNTWHECRAYALRAAGLYGEVYRYDIGLDGKWKAVEKVYGGRKNER